MSSRTRKAECGDQDGNDQQLDKADPAARFSDPVGNEGPCDIAHSMEDPGDQNAAIGAQEEPGIDHSQNDRLQQILPDRDHILSRCADKVQGKMPQSPE